MRRQENIMNLGRHPILPMLSADQRVLLYVRAMLAGLEGRKMVD
jgi:hypothetical protein